MTKWWIVYLIGAYLLGYACGELIKEARKEGYEEGHLQGEADGISRLILEKMENDVPIHG